MKTQHKAGRIFFSAIVAFLLTFTMLPLQSVFAATTAGGTSADGQTVAGTTDPGNTAVGDTGAGDAVVGDTGAGDAGAVAGDQAPTAASSDDGTGIATDAVADTSAGTSGTAATDTTSPQAELPAQADSQATAAPSTGISSLAAAPEATVPAASGQATTGSQAAGSDAAAAAAAPSTGVTTLAVTPQSVNDTSFDGDVVYFSSTSPAISGDVIDIMGESKDSLASAIVYPNHNGPNQRFRLELQPDGYYRIVNVYSGLVLDIMGEAMVSGTQIIQYADHNGDNQRWKIVKRADGTYTLLSKKNESYCIDFKADKANGLNMAVLRPAKSTTASQGFKVNVISQVVKNGTYTVNSPAADKVLDINGQSQVPATNAIIYPPNGGLNQRFVFTYQPKNGYYTITAAHSGQVLDVFGASRVSGTAVIQYPTNGGYNQLWNITKDSSGKLVIRSAWGNLSLDLNKGSTASANTIDATTYTGAATQKWTLTASTLIDNGVVNLSISTGKNLEIVSGSAKSGAATQIHTSRDVIYQRFYVESVGTNTYVLEAVNSGLRLGVASASSTAVGVYTANNASTQKWQAVIAGNGYFYLKNVASGKYLSTTGNSVAQSAASAVTTKLNTASQLWKAVPVPALPAGDYNFNSGLGGNLRLDNFNNTSAVGNMQDVWTANETFAQKYRLTLLANQNYTITNIGSGLNLQVKSNSIASSTGKGTLIQNIPNSSSTGQQWNFAYAGGGYFYITSALAGQQVCLSVDNNTAVAGTAVNIWNKTAGTKGQYFKPVLLGETSYITMNMSIATFTAWQAASASLDGIYNTSGQLINPCDPTQNGDRMLQFMDLRKSTGLTAAQINAYIDSSAAGKTGLLHGQGATIVAAAKKYGINEVYLIAHANLESGWGNWVLGDAQNQGYYYDGTTLVSDGNGGMRTYPAGTYYNFFGIGAVDSAPVTGGQAMAIRNGWNSVQNAIMGGAEWIAENYIYGIDLSGNGGGILNAYPQPTLYAMKWDPYRSNAEMQRGWRQYATDPTWARKVAANMETCYLMNGGIPKVSYIVPKFPS
ncbi:MAG: RICIN domain-containing protein [Coriobacteriia bacterium]|nr:RICIN domain-containing protein [Coriobacteriia bacterium]